MLVGSGSDTGLPVGHFEWLADSLESLRRSLESLSAVYRLTRLLDSGLAGMQP